MNDAHRIGRQEAEAWIADHADWDRKSLPAVLREGLESQGAIMLKVEGPRPVCELLGCTEAELPEALARFDAGWLERIREEIEPHRKAAAVRKARAAFRVVR